MADAEQPHTGPVGPSQRARRESLFCGPVDKVLAQAEPFLASQRGVVAKMQVQGDHRGQLNLFLVVEHDIVKEKSR